MEDWRAVKMVRRRDANRTACEKYHSNVPAYVHCPPPRPSFKIAASFGKKVAVLDYVIPSPYGECVDQVNS